MAEPWYKEQKGKDSVSKLKLLGVQRPAHPPEVHCFSEEMNEYLAPRLSFLYTTTRTIVKFYSKIHVSCIVLHIQMDLYIHYSQAAAVTVQQYKLFLNNAEFFSKFEISWCHSCRIVNTVYLVSLLVEARYLFKNPLKTYHIRMV